MAVSFDVFTGAFLAKVTEYSFMDLSEEDRSSITDGYMKRAISAFNRWCKYDLIASRDDFNRVFNIDIPDTDIDSIADIVSEGMIVQWFKPYVYKQELLETVLNTKDFTTYSPAELLMRVGNAYEKAQKDYTKMVKEYTYTNGNLSELHL